MPSPSEATLRPTTLLQQRALRAAQPLSALLELTYACNWRCVFCYNPRHHDRRGLDATEWETVLDDLRILGTLNVTITGGEPLAHPEAMRVLGAVRERRLALRLFTNGALVSEERADRLAQLRPVAIELSLHGASADTHDRATGTPGSFQAMVRGLDRLRSRGVHVVVKTPLTRLNEHELEAMVTWAEDRTLPYTVDPTITPRDDGDRSPLGFAASAEGVARLYRRLARTGQVPGSHRVEGGTNCGLGRTTLAIDPEGNVYPCPQWRQSALGNVRDTPLRHLWPHSPVRLEAARIAEQANDLLLSEGGALARFPYCPALAGERTGDLLKIDPTQRDLAEIAEAARSVAS